MPIRPLEGGQIFAGRYEILRCVASGGMGAVYEAIHTVTGRRSAIKVMLDHTLDRPELRDRFMQESRVAAQIGSEYIVDVLDAGVDPDSQIPFLVMEMLDGEDLGERVLRTGPLPGEEVVLYLWHAALALDRTHRANIVHRDLKASNLFLTTREDGTPLVKVLDFGVAKVMPLGRSSGGVTQTVGTPIYMAPEQFKMDGRVSGATDIYALGLLAYTLLVGTHYWRAEHDRAGNAFAFASLAVHGPTERATARAKRQGVTLPEAFDAWFARCTARLPEKRYQRATEAVSQLAVALGVAVPVLAPGSDAPGSYEPPSGARASSPWAAAELAPTVESASAGGSLGDHAGGSTVTAVGSGAYPVAALRPDGVGRVDPGATTTPEPLEHTHASLSVTSGGLDRPPIEGPSQLRRALLAGSAITLVAAAGLGLWWWKASGATGARSAAQVAPSAAPIEATEPAAAPTPSLSQAPPEPAPEREVTSLDELPRADETPRAARPAPAPHRRRPLLPAAPSPAAPSPAGEPAKAEAHAEETPSAGERGSITRELPTAKPTSPVNRESLYSRD